MVIAGAHATLPRFVRCFRVAFQPPPKLMAPLILRQDAPKYAETLQKLIEVRRSHGTRPEVGCQPSPDSTSAHPLVLPAHRRPLAAPPFIADLPSPLHPPSRRAHQTSRITLPRHPTRPPLSPLPSPRTRLPSRSRRIPTRRSRDQETAATARGTDAQCCRDEKGSRRRVYARKQAAKLVSRGVG